MIDPRSPVIIGVGQFLNRVDRGETAVEPAALMSEALRAAAVDAGGQVHLDDLDVIAVVAPISWRYHDPGRVVATRVGARAAQTWLSAMGGNSPQALVNRLAVEVASGSRAFGAVVGGESWWTRSRSLRRAIEPEWPHDDEGAPTWTDPSATAPFFHAAEMARGVVAPTECYPLFETALWHESGLSEHEHLAGVGELWSRFARVASDNPFAWSRQAMSADEILTPSEANRMVAYPYTKRMVANPDVEMAAGCLVASVQWARDHGVAMDRCVFVHAGTDGNDRHLSERDSFTRSPAIEIAGTRALDLASVHPRDVAHVDLYSCFPSAVQIARRELGLASDRDLTVYGGLSFAGGPWNNPTSHAIAAMVDRLRADPGSRGLVTANGGNLHKHSFGVYSTDPPATTFRHERPQDAIDARGGRSVALDYDGDVTVEAWTVIHRRDGSAERAHAATLTSDGTRVWGVIRDEAVAGALEGRDLIGARAHVSADGALDLDPL